MFREVNVAGTGRRGGREEAARTVACGPPSLEAVGAGFPSSWLMLARSRWSSAMSLEACGRLAVGRGTAGCGREGKPLPARDVRLERGPDAGARGSLETARQSSIQVSARRGREGKPPRSSRRSGQTRARGEASWRRAGRGRQAATRTAPEGHGMAGGRAVPGSRSASRGPPAGRGVSDGSRDVLTEAEHKALPEPAGRGVSGGSRDRVAARMARRTTLARRCRLGRCSGASRMRRAEARRVPWATRSAAGSNEQRTGADRCRRRGRGGRGVVV